MAILGFYFAAVGAVVSVIFSSDEHRAETLLAAALGMAAGFVLLAAVSDVSQASHFRLGL